MPTFIPGADLSERFYREAVRPLLDRRFPGLVHAAGHLGRGSDVLGFDTARSMDHDWGPRVTLFVADHEVDELAPAVSRVLGEELPFEVAGIPTHFERHPDGASVFRSRNTRPVAHGVELTSVERFARGYLGLDLSRPIGVADWMSMPWQRLATVHAGRIHHDEAGRLTSLREALDWYPHDVWMYVLACQWRRIDQEEPFPARAAHVGDGLGWRILASRQVRELMLLLFLIERQWAPYAKWLGSAFARLDCAGRVTPLLEAILTARDWTTCEEALGAAYLEVARRFNTLRIVDHVPPVLSAFHDRPYLVPHSARFVHALRAAIRDPDVTALPPHVGAIDQFADSTDVSDAVVHSRALTDALLRERPRGS